MAFTVFCSKESQALCSCTGQHTIYCAASVTHSPKLQSQKFVPDAGVH